MSVCAVTRCPSSVGASPTRQLSLQPVAIGAAVEVTKSPKPSMERAGQRPREQAGRNRCERRAGLETTGCESRPANGSGKAAVAGFRGAKRSRRRSHRGKGDGMSAQGDRTQHGRSSVVGA